jgi:ribonucleotide reductase alpha subunit
VQDVEETYSEAYRAGCKGITVYRDGSKEFQVLTVKKESKETKEPEPQKSKPEEAKAGEARSRAPKAGEPVYERPGRLMGFTDMVKLMSLTEEAEAEPLPALSGGGLALPGAEKCPACGEKALVREEGCWKCQACGYSKCG